MNSLYVATTTILLIAAALETSSVHSFAFLKQQQDQTQQKTIRHSEETVKTGGSELSTKATTNINNSVLSRRGAFVASLGIASSGFLLQNYDNKPSAAWAAGSSGKITAEDKIRIKKGYENIKYLLEHFDQETTICREGGGSTCKRDPDAVRRALGLRSTTDPFFQIDKVFAKAKNMGDEIDIDKLENLFDAIEEWDSAISMSNSMAFISQFGEYNPGGGQETVLKYLLESKTQVEAAYKALDIIMDSLDIPK